MGKERMARMVMVGGVNSVVAREDIIVEWLMMVEEEVRSSVLGRENAEKV
jgi:hypothetical protein